MKTFQETVNSNTIPPDEPEWAWSVASEFITHGPFCCREFTLEDAQEHADNEDYEREEIILGHAVWPDPKAYIRADVDSILEQMEHVAMVNELYRDDNTDGVFVCTDRAAATVELQTWLEAWAAKWLSATAWSLEEVERVKLTGTLGRGTE